MAGSYRHKEAHGCSEELAGLIGKPRWEATSARRAWSCERGTWAGPHGTGYGVQGAEFSLLGSSSGAGNREHSEESCWLSLSCFGACGVGICRSLPWYNKAPGTAAAAHLIQSAQLSTHELSRPGSLLYSN